MNAIFIGLLGIVVLVVVLSLIAKQSTGKPAEFDNLEYQKIDALFTAAERSFYGVLKLAVDNHRAEVFGKVRVADVITPKKGKGRGGWQKAFNRISRKHFDFLICSSDDLSLICAIELNDKSHNSKKRKERDEFLVSACKSAEVPLVQFPAQASYQVADIRKALDSYLLHLPENMVKSEIREASSAAVKQAQPPQRVCPKCSSKLVAKVAKKGKHAGEKFWACSAFPNCRFLEAKIEGRE